MSRLLVFSGVPIDDSATFFRSGIMAKRLKEKGYDVCFLSVSTFFNGVENKNLNGLDVIFIGQGHYFAKHKFSARRRLGLLRIVVENLKTCYRLVKILKKVRPDKILIVTTMPVALIVGLTTKSLGFKTIIDIEDLAIGQMHASNYPSFLVSLYSLVEKNLVKIFDERIVPSKYLEHRYRKATLIENMVDVNFWKCEKIKYSKINQKIVFVGNIGKYHGQIEALSVFSKILKRHKYWQLVFIGGGEQYKKLESKIKSLKLEKQVVLTGQVSQNQVKKILNTANIGILPLWDTPVHRARHPLKLLEYLSMGLVVVANNVGESGRIIKNGINGILCPSGDVECLTHSIEKILKEQELAEKIKKQAVLSVQKYSIENIIPKWVKVLN